MGNLLIYSAVANSCIWQQALPRYRPSHASVEAVMAYVLQELLLYCCLAAFVTGIVLAAATLIS